MSLREYDSVAGVPRLHYYLTEITQFGDFEVPEIEVIRYVSTNKQELVDLCAKNNWALPELKNDPSGWYTHHIEYRGLM